MPLLSSNTFGKNILIEPDRFKYWYFMGNIHAYPYQRNHFVFLHKQHRTKLEELTTEEYGEILTIVLFAKEKYDIPGGLIPFRFGDLNYSGATLTHLHGHIQVPDLTGPVVATSHLPKILLDRLKAGESIYHPCWVPPAKVDEKQPELL